MIKTNVLIILSCLLFVQCNNNTTREGLVLEYDDAGKVYYLKNSYSKMHWEFLPGHFYHLDSHENIKSDVGIKRKSEDVYVITLVLKNTGTEPIRIEPHFPYIKQWKFTGAESKNVFHLFPRQGEMANSADGVRYKEVYSGNFPFQFFDISHEGYGGMTIQLLDESNYPKKFYFNRFNSAIDFGVIHRAKSIMPGESWIMPEVEISAHKGDWHEAFYRYRNWLTTVLKPVTARKDWFRDIYNFRQTFLYNNGGEIGAYNLEDKKIDLENKVNESVDAFGGVDYLHLFDWGQTPKQGRCGDYSPWHFLDKEKLLEQINIVKSKGIPVGLYHEGYLLSPNSKVCVDHGKEWQMLNRNMQRYDRFGSGYYYPCPSVFEWREYISKTAKRTSTELNADGVYIDQFGFGWQYGCFNPAHNHNTDLTSIDSELQVQAEAELMLHIKKKLSPSVVSYSEECPTDISTQYQDGSFTYAISVGRDPSRHNPSVINLARFAFPDYKLIEILHVDSPVGDDIDGIRHIFFNGEGIWLSGPLGNPSWFPEALRTEIRKCYTILREHKDAFRSLNPEPLVQTLSSNIKANYFPSDKKRVWTFYNISDQDYNGEVLEIEPIQNSRYYDAWNRQFIKPTKKGDKLIIELPIRSKDIGCLAQYF